MRMDELIERLVGATIGATFNFYRDGTGAETRRERLREYLGARQGAPLLLVGEAAERLPFGVDEVPAALHLARLCVPGLLHRSGGLLPAGAES